MSKKNKKTFSEGLDTMFEQVMEEKQLTKNLAQSVSDKTERKGVAVKSFSSSLEELFNETIEETVREKATAIAQGKTPELKERRTKPVFGLDALIRSTVEESVVQSDKKRISFAFDVEKIEKLKSIARIEKARLSDIVDELISTYINKHELNT
jgi:hypothetical protein